MCVPSAEAASGHGLGVRAGSLPPSPSRPGPTSSAGTTLTDSILRLLRARETGAADSPCSPRSQRPSYDALLLLGQAGQAVPRPGQHLDTTADAHSGSALTSNSNMPPGVALAPAKSRVGNAQRARA